MSEEKKITTKKIKKKCKQIVFIINKNNTQQLTVLIHLFKQKKNARGICLSNAGDFFFNNLKIQMTKSVKNIQNLCFLF